MIRSSAITLSEAKPWRGLSQPIPPPSVRSGGADVADDARHRRQAVRLGLDQQVAVARSGAEADGAGVGVDVDAVGRAEVDHEAAVDRAVAGDVAPAAADRQLQAAIGRDLQRRHDVGRAAAAGDDRGPQIGAHVVDGARGVVAGVARQHDLAAEATAEGGGGDRVHGMESIADGVAQPNWTEPESARRLSEDRPNARRHLPAHEAARATLDDPQWLGACPRA